jgi:Family of unknown function (DUF6461)
MAWVTGWERYVWADEATEATVAVVADGTPSAEELLARLGRVEEQGALHFDAALDLQGALYDDGTFDEKAVVQAERLPGHGGDQWVTVEPNGFRACAELTLRMLAAGRVAVSFYWNVNAVMSVLKVEAGHAVVRFDPLLEIDQVPEEGRDLPFADQPRAAAMALLERWTGVSISERWFLGTKPTFIVHTPAV